MIRSSVFTCKWCVCACGEVGGEHCDHRTAPRGREDLCWEFTQHGPYQMKSRPLREGGSARDEGWVWVEGLRRRIEQLAESRVQPQKHTEPRHAEHGGNLHAMRSTNTQPLVFLSATSQQVWAHNHTQKQQQQHRGEEGVTQTKKNTITRGGLQKHIFIQASLHVIRLTERKGPWSPTNTMRSPFSHRSTLRTTRLSFVSTISCRSICKKKSLEHKWVCK